METKRNKEWRKKHCFRVFKKRLSYFAQAPSPWVMDDGRRVYRPRWDELAQCHWTYVYKTTGRPCSCWMCRGERYDRHQTKKVTKAMIADELH